MVVVEMNVDDGVVLNVVFVVLPFDVLVNVAVDYFVVDTNDAVD